MKTLLSKTIRALSLITLSLWALSAAAATNYVSFSTLPPANVISNADGLAFYWKSNGVFFSKRIAWSNLFAQLTLHATNADLAKVITGTNFDAQFARVIGTNANPAITTNQVGIWLIHSNGTKGFYTNDLAAAYGAEVPDDVLFFDPGYYVAGFTISKPVTWTATAPGVWNWKASRHQGGVVVTNGVSLAVGCSNSLFENIAFERGDAAFVSSINVTNVCNNVLRNLSIGQPGHAGGHNLYITGNGWLIEGCKIYNSLNHGLAILGSSNVIVRDCISLGNQATSYIIKADVNQCGGVGNILFQNCIGDSAFPIEAYNNLNEPRNVSKVTLKDIMLNNSQKLVPTGPSLTLHAQTNCNISDVTLNGVSMDGYGPSDAACLITIYQEAGGSLTNILVQNCSINNRYRDSQLCTYTGVMPWLNQFHFTDNVVNGQKQNGAGQAETKSLFSTVNTNGDRIFIPLPDYIEQVAATNGCLYLFWTNFPVLTDYLTTGDPIWVSNGAAAGTYYYLSNGVQSAGSPVSWGKNGYSFIAVTYFGTNGAYAPDPYVMHGKVLAWVYRLPYYKVALAEALVIGKNAFNEANGSLEYVWLGGNSASVPVIHKESWSADKLDNNLSMNVRAHAWDATNGVFFGAFCQPTFASWVSTGFKAVQLELTVHTPEQITFMCPTNSWSP